MSLRDIRLSEFPKALGLESVFENTGLESRIQAELRTKFNPPQVTLQTGSEPFQVWNERPRPVHPEVVVGR